MAKRSIVRAIRNKSKTAYPTANVKPHTLNGIHSLDKKVMIGTSDEELERKYIDGGYRRKNGKCDKCFQIKSVNGTCSC